MWGNWSDPRSFGPTMLTVLAEVPSQRVDFPANQIRSLSSVKMRSLQWKVSLVHHGRRELRRRRPGGAGVCLRYQFALSYWMPREQKEGDQEESEEVRGEGWSAVLQEEVQRKGTSGTFERNI